MSTILYIVLTLLVFTFIVVVHEWGHFFMARKNGIFVEEFSIGMGPVLFKHITKKKMQFSIRLLPIGGFCRMKGEDPEEEQDADSFMAKTPGQRAQVVAAGPIMNFILSFVLLLILDAIFGYTVPVVTQVEEDYPAAQAGLETGDELISLNGERLHVYDKISFLLMDYQEGDQVTLVVKDEEGVKKTLTFTLKYDEENERYRMGFSVSGSGSLRRMCQTWGFFGGIGHWIRASFWMLLYEIEITIRSLGMLLTGKVGLDALTGPIGMVSVVGDAYEMASAYGVLSVIGTLMNLTILISANLGVLNLFPIPGLDGSQLVFLLIEKIRKKPMDARLQNVVFLIGFILLFGLMIAVGINDVMKLVH